MRVKFQSDDVIPTSVHILTEDGTDLSKYVRNATIEMGHGKVTTAKLEFVATMDIQALKVPEWEEELVLLLGEAYEYLLGLGVRKGAPTLANKIRKALENYNDIEDNL